MYIYQPVFESGANYFPSMFAWTIAALFLYQITVIGVVALKLGSAQSPLLIPLPVITLMFYYYCINHFNIAAQHPPLFEACKATSPSAPLDGQAYSQPELTTGPLSLQAAIKEQETDIALTPPAHSNSEASLDF